MGNDPVRGVATYGSGCMPGCARQFAWWQEVYDTGSLGCYNPASVAGGGPSLHAEGRAMDIALNANDPAERARGDAIFDRVMANPDQFGAQEMLFRGYLWSYGRQDEGKRGPGIQQDEHMNHVHLGIDVNAAKNWDPSWVTDGGGDDMPSGDEVRALVKEAMLDEIMHNADYRSVFQSLAQYGAADAIKKDDKVKQALSEVFLFSLSTEKGQEILRKALKGE